MGVHGSVCIIGSGPTGLYAAEEIRRQAPLVTVDVIDRLPTPYGLVRGGVAPDHQKTKSVVRQFEPLFTSHGVRFVGNVRVGEDVDLAELRRLYDAVVLAVGAAGDRRLGVPGEDLPGVYGSAAFVGWYNGHPDWARLAPRIPGPRVAVVGNGNVALDVARILALTPGEMAVTDLARPAAEAIAASPLTDIYLLGRRGPLEAQFTSAELREMGELSGARPVVQAADLPADVPAAIDPRDARRVKRNLDILRGFADATAAAAADDPRVRVHFLFRHAPRAILGNAVEGVTGLLAERTPTALCGAGGARPSGQTTTSLAVGTVVTCIGYRATPFPGLPLDDERGVIANVDGVVEPGLFVAGWARHGPRGVIGANRASAREAAEQALAYLRTVDTPRPGGSELERLLQARGFRVVDFAGWQQIDAAERAAGDGTRPRDKFIRIDDMLAVVEQAAAMTEAGTVEATPEAGTRTESLGPVPSG